MPARKASKKSASSHNGGGSKVSAKRSASSSGRRTSSRSAKKRTSASVVAPPVTALPPTGILPPGGVVLVPNVLVVNMIPKSLSGETNQDSEPSLAVNPANPKLMVGSAFTPDPGGGPNAPIFISVDGGNMWALKSTVPSNIQTGDITVAYSGSTNNLYTGILKRPGSLLLNVLRTLSPGGPAAMSVLSSRSQVDQPYVAAITINGKDRVYVGDNDLALFGSANGKTATVDQTLDGAVATPAFTKARIEKRSTGSAGQNGPQIRPACHSDGTVYATFYGWRAFSNTSQVTADVVVVRDDNGGAGTSPYAALVDAGTAGMRVVKGVKFVWGDQMGQQRLGGDLAIAVDPKNSKIVYLAYAGVQAATGYTLHLRRSLDSGQTWSGDLRTIDHATNPGLAINNKGKVAFLYQKVTGSGSSQRWVTRVERSTDGINWNTLVLANVPASSPAPQFQPYVGDYVHLLSVGKDFYGIFSANNTPDLANFPCGVNYKRNANFNTHKLLANNGTSVVLASIDPFFLKITE